LHNLRVLLAADDGHSNWPHPSGEDSLCCCDKIAVWSNHDPEKPDGRPWSKNFIEHFITGDANGSLPSSGFVRSCMNRKHTCTCRSCANSL